MGNSEAMQVEKRICDLMYNFRSAFFRKFEFALFQISEEIAASDEFDHNVPVVLILKDVV